MSEQLAKEIKLELEPNPEGDNSFQVKIKERDTRLTYFASKLEKGRLVNAGDVTIVFSKCIASRYIGSEPDGNLYPGLREIESHFCEIEKSEWVSSFPEQCRNYHHYMFCLNHQIFECVAESFNVHGPRNE